MGMTDWISNDEMAQLAAEELDASMTRLGIEFYACYVNGSNEVAVSFTDIKDAEAFVSLGVTADMTPGTLYDRATSSCVSLAAMAGQDEPPDREQMEAAVHHGWSWTIHPHMIGRRMDWHVAVDMLPADAALVTAHLNAIWRVKP